MPDYAEQIFLEWLVDTKRKGPLALEKQEKHMTDYEKEQKKQVDKDMTAGLLELRNDFLTKFFGVNLIWLVLMTVVSVLGDVLSFQLSEIVPTRPCNSTQMNTAKQDDWPGVNATTDCAQGFCGYPCIYN